MKHYIFLAALLSSVYAVEASAQTTQPAPIFVQPYQQQQPTYTSRVPSIVQAPQQQAARSYTKAGRKSYEIVTAPDPFKGTAYGRITNEITILDKKTGKFLNQYDYMAALKQRGDIAELNNVVKKLQTTGVFDPAKYQAAMNPQMQAQQPTANGGVSGSNASGTTTMPKTQFVYKGDGQSSVPQKLHNGYDDEAPQVPTAPQNKNAPIFLR